MELKELTTADLARFRGVQGDGVTEATTQQVRCLLTRAKQALTAEQIIKRDGLAALNIRTMVELADVSINTLKRWALRDPEQFSNLVQKANGQLADMHAENAVGVLLDQLGTGYGVRQDVADGVMKLGVYRADTPTIMFVITCSYDAPDCYLRAKAQQAKEHLDHV